MSPNKILHPSSSCWFISDHSEFSQVLLPVPPKSNHSIMRRMATEAVKVPSSQSRVWSLDEKLVFIAEMMENMVYRNGGLIASVLPVRVVSHSVTHESHRKKSDRRILTG